MSQSSRTEFRYDVEVQTARGRTRTFQYVARSPLHVSGRPLRHHGEWFIADAITQPLPGGALGVITGTDIEDLMRNDVQDAFALREGWDAPSPRHLARACCRGLREDQGVRWLLVVPDPPSLRALRQDGTEVSVTMMQVNVGRPVFRALIEMSIKHREAQ
jgi:hypothetical protein